MAPGAGRKPVGRPRPHARPGDLAILEVVRTDVLPGSGPRVRYEIHEVAGLSNGSTVRSVRDIVYDDEHSRALYGASGINPTRVAVIPASAVHKVPLIAEARAHLRPGCPLPQPYGSLAEVRALLDRHRRTPGEGR